MSHPSQQQAPLSSKQVTQTTTLDYKEAEKEEQPANVLKPVEEGKVCESMQKQTSADFFAPANLRAHIERVIRRQHKAKHGSAITADELATYADQIDAILQGGLLPPGQADVEDGECHVSETGGGDEHEPEEAEVDASGAEGSEDEDMESGAQLTEAQLRQEVHEALDHVRALGAAHGRVLAERFSQTFQEANGRLPDEQELAGIFARVRGEFVAETREVLLAAGDAQMAQDEAKVSDSARAAAGYDGSFTVNWSEEEKARLEDAARAKLPVSLQERLRAKFVDLVGREPTEAEFSDLLVATATTPIVDTEFANAEDDEDDDDYVPTAEELMAEAQDEADDAAVAELSPEEVAELAAEVRELCDMAAESDAATTTFASQLTPHMLEEAKGQFVTLYQRAPTAQELEQVAEYMLTTRLMYATFDSDDDSDYVPDEKELAQDEQEGAADGSSGDEEEEEGAVADDA